MKLHIFEGTPQEIKQVLDGMNSAIKPAMAVPSEAQRAHKPYKAADDEEECHELASVKFCQDVLSRRPLPDTQRKMYQAVYAAYPESLSYEELQGVLGYNAAQIAGFWGAHGRRVSHTEGYEESGDMFVWDHDGFTLTPNMKEAIELEGVAN